MKKTIILLALSAILISCNSGNNNEVANDTTRVGEKISADAQQSSVDTNVNKIGTDPLSTDTIKTDSSQNK